MTARDAGPPTPGPGPEGHSPAAGGLPPGSRGAGGLPPVAPDVLADAVDMLPGRLRRRLDDAVAQAPGWPSIVDDSGGVVVAADGPATVRLAAVVRTAQDAHCDCLLAPRCLHRAALLAAAPVLDAAVGQPSDGPGTPADEPAGPPPTEPAGLPSPDAATAGGPPTDPGGASEPAAAGTTVAQRQAAARLWRAAVPVLETGVPGAGAVVQAQLLRAVHEARAAGLPRASAAAVRVVGSLRAARREEPGFRLAELTDDVLELLATCHQLTGDHGDPMSARGSARREYEDVGSLRLFGVFTEPVLTMSGYAGASTYLCDHDCRLWTVSDVRPGGLTEARSAADGAVTLGEARLSHREAARAGLVVAGARASTNGRLSGGGRTQAVRSAGRRWTEEPLAALWAPPADQLGRYRDALALPVSARPAGHDLAFLRGTLLTVHSGLTIDVDGVGPVTVTAGLTDPAVPTVANLRQLVRAAAGQAALLVGRFAGARAVHGLALAAAWLPEHFGGHVDLAVDVLQRSDLPGAQDAPRPAAGAVAPPPAAGPVPVPAALQLLRHRIERAVSGGRAAVRTPSAGDAVRLTTSHLPYGAALLTALHDAAQHRTRDVFGRLDPVDSDRLATAWLATALYAAAAERHLVTAGWLPPDS